MSDAEPLVYSLDACDRIVRVNDAWTRFALENDAPELAAQHVLRRSIWDFLDDPTTRQIYADLFSRVREGRTASFSLRCDSPTLRRHLTMIIRPAERNSVDFQCAVVAVESRPTHGSGIAARSGAGRFCARAPGARGSTSAASGWKSMSRSSRSGYSSWSDCRP